VNERLFQGEMAYNILAIKTPVIITIWQTRLFLALEIGVITDLSHFVEKLTDMRRKKYDGKQTMIEWGLRNRLLVTPA
jgi:hypothetical protein